MAKYEIMLIVDPKADIEVAQTLVNEIFKNAKFEKLDRTELAYEINKSKTAQYALVNTEATADEVKEFIRRANIQKAIWRHLAINLDSEMGREKALVKIAERKEKLAQRAAEYAARKEAERNSQEGK